MRAKDYKYLAIKKLQSLLFNLDNTKQDYKIEDLKSILKDSEQAYEDYLLLKENKNHLPVTVRKSYK